MTPTEMPIFSRTFDLLGWLLQVTNHFPRARRHDFTCGGVRDGASGWRWRTKPWPG
jgi:hypothetical protein